jgi:hypothetical protein
MNLTKSQPVLSPAISDKKQVCYPLICCFQFTWKMRQKGSEKYIASSFETTTTEAYNDDVGENVP